MMYILIQFKSVYLFPPEISMDNWYSECLATGQLTTTMYCNWLQFIWVKEGNNTGGDQWSLTLNEVVMSQQVKSVYCYLKPTYASPMWCTFSPQNRTYITHVTVELEWNCCVRKEFKIYGVNDSHGIILKISLRRKVSPSSLDVTYQKFLDLLPGHT